MCSPNQLIRFKLFADNSNVLHWRMFIKCEISAASQQDTLACYEFVCGFTFTGKNVKKSFRETYLYTACKQAFKSQGSFAEHEIELSFQVVLKHTKDRNRSHKSA